MKQLLCLLSSDCGELSGLLMVGMTSWTLFGVIAVVDFYPRPCHGQRCLFVMGFSTHLDAIALRLQHR